MDRTPLKKMGLSFRDKAVWPGEAKTCFVLSDFTDRYLYEANYASGSFMSCEITTDNTFGRKRPALHHQGHGLNPERQKQPHVHSLCFLEQNHLLAAVDLGIDDVLYHVDELGDTEHVGDIRVSPGSGPRMLAVRPHHSQLAVVKELFNTVWIFDGEQAGLEWRHTNTLVLSEKASPLAAHVAFSEDGRFLFVSVRESDTPCVFELDSNGNVVCQNKYSSQGCYPRHFSLSSDGRFLALANQKAIRSLSFLARKTQQHWSSSPKLAFLNLPALFGTSK